MTALNVIIAVMGFALIGFTMLLLMKGKISPIVVLIAVPVAGGLLLGYIQTLMGTPLISEKILKEAQIEAILNGDMAFQLKSVFGTIGAFIKNGVGTTTNNAIMLMFSILFFGIMGDVGVFDVIVAALVKRAGKSVIAITVCTAIVAVIGHLDGATVTTVFITIPAMYQIYKRMGISMNTLLLITASAMGVMNLVPWGGPTVRTATVLGMDANDIWMMLIPMQVVGLICTVGLAVIMGFREIKNGAGKNIITEVGGLNIDSDSKKEDLLRPNLLVFNFALVLLTIASLVMDLTDAYIIFMMATALALIVNYPSMKMQDARIKDHGRNAVLVAGTMLAAGVFVGVMDNTGMLEAMTNVLLSLIPDFLGRYVHIIFGIIGLPLGMVTGTDPYFYGIMPLVIGVGESYGVAGINTGLAMLLGKNVSLMISPMVPATFLAIGLVDVELKDHIKFCFKWLFAISLIMVFSGVLLGIIAV